MEIDDIIEIFESLVDGNKTALVSYSIHEDLTVLASAFGGEDNALEALSRIKRCEKPLMKPLQER